MGKEMADASFVVTLRRRLSRIESLGAARAGYRTLRDQFGFNLRWISGCFRLISFWAEFRHYRRMNSGSVHGMRAGDALPCLLDRTEDTPVEPVYFVQDTWFASCLSRTRPARHVDVGSSAKTMALMAQFVPVTMVDIRPVPLAVPNFTFVRGSILDLPFPDGSVESLSSLCVVEHIGLGRYGDELDASGSETAWRELVRVLKSGGDFYVSVPVDAENRIYFNAHRAFTRDYVMELSNGLMLVQEQYLYGFEIVPCFDPTRGFGTGMFHFRKS
jgi:hypothetical protein